MRKIALLLVWLCSQTTLLWSQTDSAERFYAVLKNDTLRIGNSRMERGMLWNDGNPVTLYLRDKATPFVLHSGGNLPDFSLLKGNPTNGELRTAIVPTDGIHPEYLEAVVAFTVGTLDVERRYRIYEDCPAIACDTYLRGSIDPADLQETPTMEHLQLEGRHWQSKAVEFMDCTDRNDNLVYERKFIPYKTQGYRGNLFFATNLQSGNGFFFLKEAPCSNVQLHYPGADFMASNEDIMVTGLGVSPEDLSRDEWTPAYGCVTGVYQTGELQALTALRNYQKKLRQETAEADEMIMMNTWGDRSQEVRINEEFCLKELELGSRLGITVFQLDDGWQSGKSPNQKGGGSFKDIWKDDNYWIPNPRKFPDGLTPVVEKGRELGIRIGIWFNPSIQNEFADWEKDAAAMIGLHNKYGIDIFKIDGLQIPTKRAETNLCRLFDKVSAETNHQVIFDLDATAGQRGGYFMMAKYGNIFLENRYTDWGNYYPFHTLRNLWQLSRYVPAEKIQIEFLNPWRNPAEYPENDMFAPQKYDLPYLFAQTMAAQPLAWMEAHNLPDDAFRTGELIKTYHTFQHRLHQGTILPIGEEPNGLSWTGFQSILTEKEGYIIVYRENNDQSSGSIQTWLPANAKIKLRLLAGDGKNHKARTDSNGKITFHLPAANRFAVYQYTICCP